jgi:cytochrome P450
MTVISKPPETEPRQAPGPKGRRLVGVLPEVKRDPIHYLIRTAQDYGDVVCLPVGPAKVYMLTNPRHVGHVLQHNNKNYRKSDFYKKVQPVLGMGMITSDGDLWRAQRQLTQPAFRRERIMALGEIMLERTNEAVSRWERPEARHEPIDISFEMMQLSLEIIVRAIFSRDIGPDADTIVDCVTTMLAEAERRVWSLYDLPLAVPTPNNRRVSAALKTLNAIILRLITERRTEAEEQNDLLSFLLAARTDDGQPWSDQQLLDQVKTLIVAGHETSGSALTSTWYLLSLHPDIRERLEREVADAIGTRPVAVEHLPKLKYTKMVIQEAMRIYPPAWTISRAAIEDDVIGGYRIPAGATVMLSPFLVHRNPKYWPNPEGFDPERFDPDKKDAIADFSYLPFGGGARKCIAEHFAMMEMVLAVATIAQRYRLDLVPGRRIEPMPMISMRLGPSVPMMLHRRSRQQPRTRSAAKAA